MNGGIEAEEIIPDQLPEPEQESEEDMATGDKLVNLDDLKVTYEKQQEDTNSLKSALTNFSALSNEVKKNNLFEGTQYDNNTSAGITRTIDGYSSVHLFGTMPFNYGNITYISRALISLSSNKYYTLYITPKYKDVLSKRITFILRTTGGNVDSDGVRVEYKTWVETEPITFKPDDNYSNVFISACNLSDSEGVSIDDTFYIYLTEGKYNKGNFITNKELYDKFYDGSIGYVTPEMFGAVGDGTTDDTEAFVNMINSGIRVMKCQGNNYVISEDLSIPSNADIDFCNAKVTFKNGSGIKINNKTNIILQNAIFEGDNETEAQECIVIYSSTKVIVQNCSIDKFKNKCIAVNGSSYNCRINSINCYNADSNTGAGISLFGANVRFNQITNIYAEKCRLGVVLNSAYRNNVSNLIFKTCTEGGLHIDAGDPVGVKNGSKYNVFNNIIGDQNTGIYGLVYIGGASSYNTISGINSKNDSRAVTLYDDAKFNNINNVYCENPTDKGIVLSSCEKNTLCGITLKNYSVEGTYGIDIYGSVLDVIECVYIEGFSTGIRIIATGCIISGGYIKECTSYGMQIAYGQGTPQHFILEGLMFFYNEVAYSGVNNVQLGTTCKIVNRT